MTICSFLLTPVQIAEYDHNNNKSTSCRLVASHWLQAAFVAQARRDAATAVTVGRQKNEKPKIVQSPRLNSKTMFFVSQHFLCISFQLGQIEDGQGELSGCCKYVSMWRICTSCANYRDGSAVIHVVAATTQET